MEEGKKTILYSFNTLLDRVYSQIKEPDKKDLKHEYKILPPIVSNTKNKKVTRVINFPLICDQFRRTYTDVMNYFLAELLTDGSLDANNSLVLKGFFKENAIQSLLVKYAKNYVICKECKGASTDLIKKERLLFLSCNLCLSQRTINE